jgi:uncharacterized phage-associated protein
VVGVVAGGSESPAAGRWAGIGYGEVRIWNSIAVSGVIRGVSPSKGPHNVAASLRHNRSRGYADLGSPASAETTMKGKKDLDTDFHYSSKKFKELVLYVSARSENDPEFGPIKLNKILFYSDFWAYALWGKPITGATYKALLHGPGPSTILPAIEELEAEGRAVVVPKADLVSDHKRLVARVAPDLSEFDAKEISLVERFLEAFRSASGHSLSKLTHETVVGWQLTSLGTMIPYSTVFLTSDPAPAEAVRFGQQVSAEHGWLSS